MHAEILDLVERDGLKAARGGVGGSVTLRIRSKGSNLDLASRDGSVGVNLQNVWIQLHFQRPTGCALDSRQRPDTDH